MINKNKILTKNFLFNEPMSKHTTYRIGGPAKIYSNPSNKSELIETLKYAKENKWKIYFIGSGSNLLVSDSGINGLVVSIRKNFNQLLIDEGEIFAETGVILGRIVRESIKMNLSGFESLVGVPGTLGGAIIMNAGAFGGEISNYLQSVKAITLNGEEKSYNANDIIFSYRSSTFPKDEILISANFKLKKSSNYEISTKKTKANFGRKSTQPLDFKSAGSVFKNPPEGAAGYFIDKAGLKGLKIGDAEISRQHANFFVNHGKAKASDLVKLIRIAKEEVKKKYDINLKLEIKTLGFEKGTFES